MFESLKVIFNLYCRLIHSRTNSRLYDNNAHKKCFFCAFVLLRTPPLRSIYRNSRYIINISQKEVGVNQLNKPVIMYLPVDLVMECDALAKELSISRSQLVRTCLKRELVFVREVQLPEKASADQDIAQRRANWSPASSEGGNGVS